MTEADLAAQVIERLLVDPTFRARFRRDPAGACREAGLDDLAEEMSLGAGKAMYTLDVRESKSSLAGVMMAAAMEGVGLYIHNVPKSHGEGIKEKRIVQHDRTYCSQASLVLAANVFYDIP